MRIEATGYRRSVVGSHTVIDERVTENANIPTEAGIRLYMSPTKHLALSGNFRLSVYFD
jgi:hypothetical protein